jgi:hypothetical protein
VMSHKLQTEVGTLGSGAVDPGRPGGQQAAAAVTPGLEAGAGACFMGSQANRQEADCSRLYAGCSRPVAHCLYNGND